MRILNEHHQNAGTPVLAKNEPERPPCECRTAQASEKTTASLHLITSDHSGL
jgi:hypothetical protein